LVYHVGRVRTPSGGSEVTVARMKVVERTEELTHVALDGRLDIAGVEGVQLPFTLVVVARKLPAIVDLSGVDLVVSVGIGMLVGAAKALRSHGRTMVVLAPREGVAQVLRLSSIDKMIPIAATKEQAIALAQGPSASLEG
jgi:anti-anti-sigma factor